MSELIETARAWVKKYNRSSAEHLLKSEEWLRRINPDATEAMLLAALTHDMERAFPGPDSPEQDRSKGPDDPIYIEAHSIRSARFVTAFLSLEQAPNDLLIAVGQLVRMHEVGGTPEANWVQAADSLSFLDVNVDAFLEHVGAARNPLALEYVRAKIDWMYNRIQIPEARELASPLYAKAQQKILKKSGGNGSAPY